METLRYYRCDNANIIAVFDDQRRQQDKLVEQGNKLAEQVTALTGQPCSVIYTKDVTRVAIAGVRFESFNEALAVDFFKPTKSQEYVTRPRKQADPQLQALFQNLPYIDRVPAWEALGIEWGELLFSPLKYVHSLGEFLYVASAMDLTDTLVEITGGEYQKAEDQAEQQNQRNTQ